MIVFSVSVTLTPNESAGGVGATGAGVSGPGAEGAGVGEAGAGVVAGGLAGGGDWAKAANVTALNAKAAPTIKMPDDRNMKNSAIPL